MIEIIEADENIFRKKTVKQVAKQYLDVFCFGDEIPKNPEDPGSCKGCPFNDHLIEIGKSHITLCYLITQILKEDRKESRK